MLTVAAEIPKKNEKAQLMGKHACVGFFTFNKTYKQLFPYASVDDDNDDDDDDDDDDDNDNKNNDNNNNDNDNDNNYSNHCWIARMCKEQPRSGAERPVY